MPLGRFLIGNAPQYALPDQLLEPFGEQMARDSERRLKSFKPPRAQKALPQDHEGPAIADHADGARQRTRLFLQGIPLHQRLQRICSSKINSKSELTSFQ